MVTKRYILIIAIVLCVFALMAESYAGLEKRGKRRSKKSKNKPKKSKNTGRNRSDTSNNGSDSSIAGILVADVTSAVNNVVSGFFDGWATFFHPVTEGGKYGACYGIVESDKSNIVALVSY